MSSILPLVVGDLGPGFQSVPSQPIASWLEPPKNLNTAANVWHITDTNPFTPPANALMIVAVTHWVRPGATGRLGMNSTVTDTFADTGGGFWGMNAEITGGAPGAIGSDFRRIAIYTRFIGNNPVAGNLTVDSVWQAGGTSLDPANDFYFGAACAFFHGPTPNGKKAKIDSVGGNTIANYVSNSAISDPVTFGGVRMKSESQAVIVDIHPSGTASSIPAVGNYQRSWVNTSASGFVGLSTGTLSPVVATFLFPRYPGTVKTEPIFVNNGVSGQWRLFAGVEIKTT